MISLRAFSLLLLPVVLAPLSAEPVRSSTILQRVYFKPATPLNEIPLYSLDSAAPDALRGLEAEIDRLYTHATTLPSGPNRRAFETRIYLLEKQLRPIAKDFDALAWETLRAAVKSEWQAVQATLPAAVAPAVEKTKTATGSAPLASAS